ASVRTRTSLWRYFGRKRSAIPMEARESIRGGPATQVRSRRDGRRPPRGARSPPPGRGGRTGPATSRRGGDRRLWPRDPALPDVAHPRRGGGRRRVFAVLRERLGRAARLPRRVHVPRVGVRPRASCVVPAAPRPAPQARPPAANLRGAERGA